MSPDYPEFHTVESVKLSFNLKLLKLPLGTLKCQCLNIELSKLRFEGVDSMGVKWECNSQAETIDDQPPVFYLAIRQQSEDLKHLIPRTGPPGLQG